MSARKKSPVRVLRLALMLLAVLCAASAFAETQEEASQRTVSLSEYLEQGGGEWFLTGKKEYAVQAMMVSGEMRFRNELEVTDYVVQDDGVTVVLKGCFGEMWASKLPRVLSTYTKPDGSALSESDFAVRDVFIDLLTRLEPGAYYAMHVPPDISVTVATAWGDVLHTNLPNAPHGDGDYLVCRVNGDGGPDLADVWVLNGVVFPEYYDMPPSGS